MKRAARNCVLLLLMCLLTSLVSLYYAFTTSFSSVKESPHRAGKLSQSSTASSPVYQCSSGALVIVNGL